MSVFHRDIIFSGDGALLFFGLSFRTANDSLLRRQAALLPKTLHFLFPCKDFSAPPTNKHELIRSHSNEKYR
jgi:hypothetical protein